MQVSVQIGLGVLTPSLGFIQQFGTVTDSTTGAIEIDALYISLWGGFNFVAQIMFQALSPITGDRYGRKLNMWLFTMSMVIVGRLYYQDRCFKLTL